MRNKPTLTEENGDKLTDLLLLPLAKKMKENIKEKSPTFYLTRYIPDLI